MTWKHAVIIGVVAGLVMSIILIGLIVLTGGDVNPILTPFVEIW